MDFPKAPIVGSLATYLQSGHADAKVRRMISGSRTGAAAWRMVASDARQTLLRRGDAMIIGGDPRPAPSMDEEERWRRGKDDGRLSAAHPVSPPDACRTGRHSDGGGYQCIVCLGAYGADAGEIRKGTEGRTIPSGGGPAGGSDTPTHRTRMARPGPQARREPLSSPPLAGIVRSAGRSTIETVARRITIRRWVRCYGHKHMATVFAYLMMPTFPRWDSGEASSPRSSSVAARCSPRRAPRPSARAPSGTRVRPRAPSGVRRQFLTFPVTDWETFAGGCVRISGRDGAL